LQLASGLAAAHARGVIHRDLKPANIQLTADGTAKILDFGIASVKRTLTTQTGISGHLNTIEAVAGTPGYMSPEQWQRRSVDERSDIFSLGLVLFEMTTGRRAFGSEPLDAQTPAVPRADFFDRKVPRSLADVISRTVAIDPAERIASANELRESLERVQRQLATPWWQGLVGTGLPAITRVFAGVLLLACLCIALGYISSMTFNVALERTDYVDDTVWTWLNWGRRSVVADALSPWSSRAVIGLLVVLRNVLLPMSARLRSWDRKRAEFVGRITVPFAGTCAGVRVMDRPRAWSAAGPTWWTFCRILTRYSPPSPGLTDEQLRLLGLGPLDLGRFLEISLVVLTIAATGAAVWIGRVASGAPAPSQPALMSRAGRFALLALISSQLRTSST
jgi:hypothetical protein